MPTYQYACTECGHRLEAVQSFTDDPLTECVECGGRLRKVFNSVGIVFKGSGFYRNDSREKSAKSESAPDSKSASDKSARTSGGDDKSKTEKASRDKSEPASGGSGGSKSESGPGKTSGSGSSTAGSAA